MISKSIGMLLTVVALSFALPVTNASAAISSADKAKIAKLFKQLKGLANAGASSSQVNSLVVKLVKIDPAKANTYFKTGLTKLDNATGTAKSSASKIANTVNKTVSKSGALSESKKKSVIKQVTKSDTNFNPPPPQPPS